MSRESFETYFSLVSFMLTNRIQLFLRSYLISNEWNKKGKQYQEIGGSMATIENPFPSGNVPRIIWNLLQSSLIYVNHRIQLFLRSYLISNEWNKKGKQYQEWSLSQV